MSTFLRSLRPGPATASRSRTGSVPPIYTKGDTLYYTDVVAGAPRDRSCALCGLVEAHGGSGDVRRRSAPTGHRIPARGETPGMAHNRSVLKERRIPPDALACFAVAECRGWRWGSVPRRRLEDIGRGGSAEPVLRSQGTLGQVGLSRWRARGDRVSTFLRLLRPGPAAALGCITVDGVLGSCAAALG